MYIDKIHYLIARHRDILEILNYDNTQNAMLVGGCVRDFLKNEIISEDIDISTILKPEEVIRLLRMKQKTNKYITILDKDKKYGTIVVILNGQKYEITTTRKDILCYGRKAEVEFCKSFEEDSKRRDFTINAIYLTENGKIIDFHNGLKDLENNTIKFIGNPNDRIAEDYLRIIRFFRFTTKYNVNNFDNLTITAIINNKKGILKLSRERIRNEIWKMLEYENWFVGLKNLKTYNLLEEIFLLQNEYITTSQNSKNFVNNNSNSDFDKIVKLFYFFNFDLHSILILSETLKFTSKEKKFVIFLQKTWSIFQKNIFNLELKYIIFTSPNIFLMEIIKIVKNDLREKILAFNAIKKPLPLKTNKLIENGYTGKKLGEKIVELQKFWIQTDFNATQEQLLNNK